MEKNPGMFSSKIPGKKIVHKCFQHWYVS